MNTLAPAGGNSIQCVVDGCRRKSKACGLCLMHYRRQQRHGDTDRRTAGRKVIDAKTEIVERLFTDWSPRTRERYTRAWRLLELAGLRIEDVIPKVTRPNGTLSVQRLLEIADNEAGRAIVIGKLKLSSAERGEAV